MIYYLCIYEAPIWLERNVILQNSCNKFIRMKFHNFKYSLDLSYPLPNLPPRGKEWFSFPPWGKMKGGSR
jgi:hypothetical protein